MAGRVAWCGAMRNVTPIRMFLLDRGRGRKPSIEEALLQSGLSGDVRACSDAQELETALLANERERRWPVARLSIVVLAMGRDGGEELDVLKRLKTEGNTRYVPVVVLSFDGDGELARACYDLGCNFFITVAADGSGITETARHLNDLLKLVAIPSPP